MEHEGSIAAMLQRSGWKVMYRATSPDLLLKNLAQYPEAFLLLSDDFLDPREISRGNMAILRGRTQAISSVGVAVPKNDFELGELLRGLRSEKEPVRKVVPATQRKVVALVSTQGGVGTTTLAINVADHIAALGKNVLLVDACSGRGRIAEHFGVHDIRGKLREMNTSPSLFEISELTHLIHLSEIAAQFEYIVIDLGVFTEKNFSGSRVSEQTFQWIVHSQGKVVVTSRSNQKAIDRTFQFIQKLQSTATSLAMESVITMDLPLSRRDRLKMESEVSERYLTNVLTMSRDSKSIHSAEVHGTTLRNSAPRSVINREVGRFTTERVI